MASQVGEDNGAIARAAGDPLGLLEGGEDGGTESPAEVVSLFAPVE